MKATWDNARDGETIGKEQSKHTPGPWNISKLATPQYAPEFGIYAENSAKDLARTVGENSEANARLIAAAPDLLDAGKDLEAIASLINARQHAGAIVRPDDWSELFHCCNVAKTAIQKAEGAL